MLYLLDVSVETEEVEDAGAVHLGGMQAAHHGNGAGGVAHVGGGLGQRIRHHLRDIMRAALEAVITGQRQQGAVRACTHTHTHTHTLQALIRTL